MGKKKEGPLDLSDLTPEEKLKLEIAAEIGYQDVSYFIEQFKARYGKTPLQYRGRR